MSGDVTPYTGLITSEHANKPNFMAMVAATLQPLADMIALIDGVPALYDLDNAVGQQLDTTGEWIGQSRDLTEPLTNVYFSFGVEGLGWGQAVWRGPYDPSTGVVSLNDTDYRTLLYAKVADNQWDGTTPGAYGVLEPVFPGDTVFIQDNGDMTIYVGVVGPEPLTATEIALLTGGYLTVKPATVQITKYITSSVQGAPVFGFGSNSATIAGFGVGAWGQVIGSS